MKLSVRQQLYTWITAGTALCLVATWVIAFPLRQSMAEKSTRILDARITLELNTRQQQNLSALKNQVEQIQKNAAALQTAFFDRGKTLAFLEYVESLAESEGLELAEPQLEAPARATTDTAITFSVEEKAFQFSLTGPIPNLMRFLRALETHPSYILIANVDLQKGETDQSAALTLGGTIPWH